MVYRYKDAWGCVYMGKRSKVEAVIGLVLMWARVLDHCFPLVGITTTHALLIFVFSF